jgi:hypothetical protein
MKTKIALILVFASIFGVLPLIAQTTTQTRSVSSFKGVSSSAGIDVVYTIGNSHTLKIEAESSIIDKIETTVENDILVIKRKKDTNYKTRYKTVVYITAPTLDKISMSGGADFIAEEIKNSNDIKINSSGGADIKISKIKTGSISINASGGSDIDIKDLTTTTCNLNASGGSDTNIKLTATDINANASGGADITLEGKVKSIKVNCSGGADADIKSLTYETIQSNASGGGKVKK